jgi:predicted DCC family thiol-disulfide oxidoreductase YuxK
MEPQKDQKGPRGWVLFDDECGVCHRTVPFFGGTLRKLGFEIAPLQSEWVRERIGALAEDQMNYMRLLFPDGREILGPDVYRYFMKRVWWSYPIYLLSVLPLLRNVFDWAYRTFAANRYRVAKACGLPGASEERRGKTPLGNV